MISWFERPQGAPTEYENAQKRILEVFGQWKARANFKIELFVARIGKWGGHVLVDCDDPLTVHKCCSTWPAFEFQARPVIAVEDAVRVELEAIAWRDGLNASDSGHRLQLRPECGSSASIDVVISALTLHHLEPAAADVRVHRYPQLARQCAVRAKRRRA